RRSSSATSVMLATFAKLSLPASRRAAAAEIATAARKATATAIPAAGPAAPAPRAPPGCRRRHDARAALAPRARERGRTCRLTRLHPHHNERHHDEKPENQQGDLATARRGRSLRPAPGALLDGLGITQQHVADIAHARLDAAGKIVAPERRQHGVLDDQLAHQVGELRLKSPTHLDAHLALIGCHDEDHAIVLALLPDPPEPPYALAKIPDRVALKRAGDIDHQLVCGFFLQCLEFALQRTLIVSRQQPYFIHDPTAERGKFRLADSRRGEKEHARQHENPRQSPCGPS